MAIYRYILLEIGNCLKTKSLHLSLEFPLRKLILTNKTSFSNGYL